MDSRGTIDARIRETHQNSFSVELGTTCYGAIAGRELDLPPIRGRTEIDTVSTAYRYPATLL